MLNRYSLVGAGLLAFAMSMASCPQVTVANMAEWLQVSAAVRASGVRKSRQMQTLVQRKPRDR